MAVTDKRIPTPLRNTILSEFCVKYLNAFDEISKYNAEVLSEKDSEHTIPSILKKARELGNPDDASVAPVDAIKDALAVWENAVAAAATAKRNVLESTAKELGITLTHTAERNSETEAPLKEKRATAFDLGKTLSNMSGFMDNADSKEAVKAFLTAHPLPMVGRDQVSVFGENETGSSGAYKYRVDVVVKSGDDVKVTEKGFTKAALEASKLYPRGEGITASKLREVWEAAGNVGDKKTQSVVEFVDNDLHYTLSQR